MAKKIKYDPSRDQRAARRARASLARQLGKPSKEDPKPSDWFFVQSERDGSCAIANPKDMSSPVCRVKTAEIATNICTAVNAKDDLVMALRRLLAANPAFRSKPMGAPNSDARHKQDKHMAAEDAARAALGRAGDTGYERRMREALERDPIERQGGPA